MSAEGFIVDRPAHVAPEQETGFDFACFGDDMDMHGAWKALQASPGPPVRWSARHGGHWLPLRAELLQEILDHPQDFSSRLMWLPKETQGVVRFIPLGLDPPEHKPYRTIVNALFTPRVVTGLEPAARAATIELIEGFRKDGGCEFVGAFGQVLPVAMFLKLLGLPAEDRLTIRAIVTGVSGQGKTTVQERLDRIGDYLRPFIDQRRRAPGDDLFSALLSNGIEGRELSDDEAMRICSQLLIAGLDTVAALLSWIMLDLARNPKHRAALRSDPRRLAVSVDELIRRYGMIAMPRLVMRDRELGGVALREGDAILVPLMLYNLDNRLFPNPMTVDFARRDGLHATFGSGIHRCPGAGLARTELRVVIEEWLARIPDFAIDPAAPAAIRGGIVTAPATLPLVWET